MPQNQIWKISRTLILQVFALKTNLVSLKTEVDKIGIDKKITAPVDLSKLSDIVKNYVVEKTVYDKLVEKQVILILVDLF